MKVLCVDDEIGIRKVITRMYSKDNEVYTAENGEVGLEVARAKRPNLILLDHDMPLMNGDIFYEHLCEDPRIRHIPIVAIGDFSADMLKKFPAHVAKPFDKPNLDLAIERALASKEPLI